MSLHGLVLAAGAGTRMGRPKALVRDEDGTSWLLRAVGVLRDGGCDAVTVVLGASASDAEPLLAGSDVAAVVADDWAEGMGASLRAGLRSLGSPGAGADAEAAVVSLVDLPDVTPEVVRRVAGTDDGPGVLARATYSGRPGHPVLLGRDHWQPIADSVGGDTGARDYLEAHDARPVECGDLATGRDVDTPTG